MVVGVIDHATGTRDIRRLAWLGRRSTPLLIIAVGATASMAALPPFLGFVAKEADFETARAQHRHSAPPRPTCSAGIVLGSVFTTIYSLRFLCGAFAPQGMTGTQQAGRRDAPAARPPSSPPRPSWRPPAWCSASGRPASTTSSTTTPTPCPAAPTTTSRCGTASNLPLLLSVLVLAVGTAAFFGRHAAAPRARLGVPAAGQRRPHLRRGDPGRRRVRGAAHRAHPARFDPGDAVGDPVARWCWCRWSCWLLGARDRPALRAVGFAAAGRGRPADPGRGARRDRDAQPAGRGAARRRDRLRLRHHLRLPRRTRSGADPVPGGDADVGDLRARAAHAARRGRPRQHHAAPVAARRAWRSPSAPASPRSRRSRWRPAPTTPIAELLPDAAYYRGHGANTVNVLLVDIRAWDTLGEISVLLVAATGVASMVFRHRRFGAAPAGRRRRSARHRPDRRRRRPARRRATSPGCAAASCATRGTGRWCLRSRRG